MKIKRSTAAVITLTLAIAGIAAAMAAGAWNTSGSNGGGNGDGNGNGASGIRGSSTFAEVSAVKGIPEEDLLNAFGVGDEDPQSLTCSGLAAFYPNQEVGTSAVRLFAALYLGQPGDLSGDAFIPEPGVRMLLDRGTLSPDEASYLAAHTAQVP